MSTNENSKLPSVKIEKVSNITYERPEEFKTSISYKAYKRAFDITQEIINDSKKYKDSLLSDKKNGTDIRNAEQICNIIFFTGDRGTGKTSVMLSYMEFLKDYYRKNGREKANSIFETFSGCKDFMFTGLEYFDASSLDNKENILGSILANMLKKWETEERRSFGNHGIRREEDYAFKKRKIQSRFSEVYKYLKNLRSDKDIMDEDSDLFIETLENMSMTWNLKQAFQQLVSEYLDIMEYPGAEDAVNSMNHFLVISIDDLDLNIKNGFSLLDEVRKYLMIPNIIVLISANYDQLEKVCINYYASEFKETKVEDNIKNYIKKLSREYVEKIMPISRQVVLYSGKEWDFFRNEEAEFYYISKTITEKRDIQDKKPDFTGTLEGLIQKSMKKYLDINFIKNGKVLHYLTPDTLRELSSWIKQIGTLMDISEESDTKLQNYRDNMKWFWNEQFPVVIKKYLEYKEQGIFKVLDTLEPVNQVRLLKRELERNYQINIKESLLQILGQLSQGFTDEQEISSLCIMYFSVKLSELMKYIRISGDEDRKKKIKIFMQYYNKGVWGVWEKNMIKPFLDARGGEKGFSKIGYTEFTQEKKCLSVELIGTYDANNGADVIRFINENRTILINYQYLLLFYRLNIDSGLKESNIWTIDQDKGKMQLTLEEPCKGLFCLSNCVINLLEGSKLIEKFVKDISNIFSDAQTENKKSAELIEKKISILRQKNEIKELNGHALLPLADVEFLINLGTELQERIQNDIVEVLNSENISMKINEFFTYINDSIRNYDNEFKEEYEKKFCEFPLVQKILYNDIEFMDMLANSILSNPQNYLSHDDDKEWSS